jgi:hypothetical protein
MCISHIYTKTESKRYAYILSVTRFSESVKKGTKKKRYHFEKYQLPAKYEKPKCYSA